MRLTGKIFGAALASLAIAVVAFFVYIRFGMESDDAATWILSRLQSGFSCSASFSSAELSWDSLLTAKLTIKDVKITTGSHEQIHAQVARATLEIGLQELVRGIFFIHKAEFHQPELLVSGDSWIEELRSLANTKEKGTFLIRSHIQRLEVMSGSLAWERGNGRANGQKIVLSGVRVSGVDITPHGIQRFSLRGVLSHGDTEGSLEFSAGIAADVKAEGTSMRGTARMIGCPLSTMKAVFPLVGMDFPFSTGSADLSTSFHGHRNQWKAGGTVSIADAVLQPGKLFAAEVALQRAGLTFSIERQNNKLTTDLTEVSVPGASLSVALATEELENGDQSLHVAVHRAEVDLEKVFPLLPLNLLREEDQRRLSEVGLGGRVVISKGAWTGLLSQVRNGLYPLRTLELVATLDKVSGFLPVVGLPISTATGEIRVTADEMLFRGISLTMGNSPIVLNGWIADLKKSPRVDLFISLKAEAQDLAVMMGSKIALPYIGQYGGWLSELGGGISLNLDLKGSLLKPDMKGRATFEDFQCRVHKIPLPIKKIQGSVRFRTSGKISADIHGMLNSSPFMVKGALSQDHLDSEGDIKLASADVRKLDMLPPSWDVSGNVPLLVNMKGKINELNFSAVVDLKNNGLNCGWIITKKPGTPLKIEASGVQTASGITFEDVALVLDKTRVSGRGAVKEDGKATLTINLPPKGIPTTALIPLVSPHLELQTGGRIEGDAVLSGGVSVPFGLEGNLQFSHLSMKLPGMHKRSEGMTGTIRYRSRSMHLSLDRAKVGSSQLSGTLTVTDFENPRMELLVEFAFFDATDFLAPPGVVHRITWGEYIRSNPVIRFLAKCRGPWFVTVVKGTTGLRPFSDFRATGEAGGGFLRVPSWQALFADGILRGSAVFDVRLATSKPFSLEFQGDRLKMERVMVSDPQWLKVTGEMNVEGRMEWKLGPSYDGRGLYKTGNMEVRMNEGVVNRFDILSKLFSLVNLGSLLRGKLPDLVNQGLPFHRLTWNTEVFDNKWKVKDLKLLSDAARIDSSGMFFSGQNRVDFKLDISPLVGFDAIFSGLFGNLITRDGKILTTTFRIRGLYTSPDVRLEPFENLRLDN